MRQVEVRLQGWKMADALGELCKWLDHNDCVPVRFDIYRAANGGLLVDMELRDDGLAERFHRDFGG
jgi:hypothetical protein